MNDRIQTPQVQYALASGILFCALSCYSCTHDDAPTEPIASPAHQANSPQPTNRVEVPKSVRMNLGMTFAKVESRAVAQTLRVPGRFEALATARREYRAPLEGHIDLLVAQYERVEAGQSLYRVISAEWGGLHEQIAATQARVDSMGPLREAHRIHEVSLEERVTLWQERLGQLEQLRDAGGGSASQFASARESIIEASAELADVREKEAELIAQQKSLEAELRSLVSRRDLVLRAGGADAPTHGAWTHTYEVRAVAGGVVDSIAVVSGGLVDDSGLVLTIVQPELIRFRARALQSDMGRLRDGLAARIVPPQGSSIDLQDTMTGTLQIGLSADPDERTVDLLMQPGVLSAWARAGVSAHLEITLAGGEEALAIPLSTVVRDGVMPIIFRRDPANADLVIRMEADLGISDGRWIVIESGVKEGDEIVLDGNYQLMLATAGNAAKGGHFHSDGTFHKGKD
ncbi:MAG: hypothetical protein EXS17_08770 [Phycisphaerales bacterium]|nr:hypothetical protein [Phycisphaerales bacterium]